jgi:carotenoid 1,2-hydratase
VSDDGRHALTIIAFIGSVFSPYYAAARRFGDGDPHNHCAINVALYGPRKRWALTERTRSDLNRDASRLQIGPSALSFDGAALKIDLDECTVPLPSRIRGTVRVTVGGLPDRAVLLDARGGHRWHPIAPCARIEVELEAPALRWKGHAYMDCNYGDEPLEYAFRRWDWARVALPDGTAVLYDIERRDGTQRSFALRFDRDGAMQKEELPERAPLATTLWGVRRFAHSEDGAPRLLQTVEDTPFYARSLVRLGLGGMPRIAMHESLSLDRVRNPIVRAMLPFRMPRYRWRAR